MAGDLRAVLEGVRERHGKLTPGALLEDATDESHPLHNRFEWDDTEAAHKYRLSQAHEIIRSFKIRDVRPDGRRRDVRQYLPVPQEAGHQPDYRPIEEVAADPFLRKLILQQMEREFLTLRRRYEDHREVFDEMVRQALGDVG